MKKASSQLTTLLVALAALSPSAIPAARAMTDADAAPAATETAKPAADFATTVAEIRKAIDERLAAINSGTEIPNRFDWTALDGQFEDLTANLRNLSAQDAKNRLRNLSGNLKSADAKALVAKLGAALDAELVVAENARQAALEQKFADISKAALAAKKSAEIDPLFNQLEDLQQEINESRGPRQSRNHNMLNRQQNFLTSWQNLLEAVGDGNRQSVRNAESNITGGYARAVGVDRSAIRARVRELSASIEAGDGENKQLLADLTLDNLAETQDRLLAVNEGFGWNSSGNARQQAISAIDQVRSATLALDAGDTDLALRHIGGYGGVIYQGGQMSENFVALQVLRTAWLERSLPALTGLKNLPARGAKEFPEPYMRRLVLAADAAGKQDDAVALARVLRRIEFRIVGIQTQPISGDDIAGAYENYVAGRRLETAGQQAEAAKSYRAAIVAGAPANLSAVLAARLKELAPAASAPAAGI